MMGFLNLNLYGHPSRVAFDPSKVIDKAKAWFPEASFLPGDQAAAEVQWAEAALAKQIQADPGGPASKVLASLRRKARSYGPNYVFTIPLPEGEPVRGLARSVGVQFLFGDPLPEPVRRRLIAFLTALGIGRLEASTGDKRRHEVLCDLHGPSDCLRTEPGVPWQSPANPEPAGTSEVS
jgi:hypothetical protein